MKELEEIRHQLQAGQFDFSHHAFRRAVERNISEQEIREVGENVIIIEDYPQDKYSPSCLLLDSLAQAKFYIFKFPAKNQISLKLLLFMNPILINGLTIPKGDNNVSMSCLQCN